jgi:trk system potassium uptake protein TrkH
MSAERRIANPFAVHSGFRDLRPAGMVVGGLVSGLAVAMLGPVFLDVLLGGADWKRLLGIALGTLFFGVALVLANWQKEPFFSTRQLFVTIFGASLILPLFSAIPFILIGPGLSFSNAVFEAVSGLTATGFSTIADVSALPSALHLWRSMLSWLGGLSAISMAVAVAPRLNIGGMALLALETTRMAERAIPLSLRNVLYVAVIYSCLSIVLSCALWLGGLNWLEAIVHASSAISSGSFSTSSLSVAGFKNGVVEFLIWLGMLISGLPFLVLVLALRGHGRACIDDNQVRWYFGAIVVLSLVIAAWLWRYQHMPIFHAAWHAVFHVTSMLTGTGLVMADYMAWGPLPIGLFFFVLMVGGCAGSTTGGVKIFRLYVLISSARSQIFRLLISHRIHVPQFNRKPISEALAESVMGYFFIYMLSVSVFAIALGAAGFDLVSALSGAAAALSNVGVAMGGTLGPFDNLAERSVEAKWIMVTAMLFGRVEMLAFLVLFVPAFWEG